MSDGLVLEVAERPVDDAFIECPECAVQPGSPPLCDSCLHNRELIEVQARRIRELETKRELLKRFVADLF